MPSLATADSEIHYERVGDGPPIVFVQGVGCAGRAWAPQVEALRDRYTCVTFDNRGLGESRGEELSVEAMARDAIAVASLVGPAHWVGHSLGGVIVQRAALERPELVRSLALLCTFSGGRDLKRPPFRLIWQGALSRIGTARSRRRAFAKLVTAPGEDLEAAIAALEAAFGRSLAEPWPISDAQLRALREHDERARLASLAAPTLVLSGAHDPIARHGRALADAIAGARYVELAAGHALPILQAAAVNEALAAHFVRS